MDFVLTLKSSPLTEDATAESSLTIQNRVQQARNLQIERYNGNDLNGSSKRYHHIGRIYQLRYFAKVVVNREGLLKVSRYIHRNPLETKVPMVNQLIDYPFSSFPLYILQQTDTMPCLNINILPKLLPLTFANTTATYVEYCLEEVD